VPGRGLHYGLPGHGFVLIDARSAERRYGEYSLSGGVPPPG